MPVTFNGRVEAKLIVPVGGASVSASNGAQSVATTVTVPEADYFHTAAGGVSSLLTTLQTQLNNNVQGYPTTAAAMQTAVGYGTWTAGYLCNETSGNLAAVFGSPATLTAASSPTYSNAGPAGGVDLAVGFNSNADSFGGGNVHDLTNATDVCIAWVGYHAATPTDTFFSKYDGGTTRGYEVKCAAGALVFNTYDGSTVSASAASLPTAAWYVGMAVADRSTGKIRVGYCSLTGSATVSTEQSQTLTTTNTVGWAMGASTWLNGTADMKVAAVYVASGASACSGLSANLSTALTNFKNAVSSTFTVATSTTTGLTTISNSFWPSSVSFTSTDLRDVLGFAYDFQYPQTAAQVTAALGGYGDFTSGAGYLCNESSGNLAAAFGTPATLTATSLTYSNIGARGGSDKAIGFDAATDNASGGDVFDVAASDDLCVVWVAKFTTATPPVSALLTKFPGATPYWYLYMPTSNYALAAGDGSFSAATSALPAANAWHVGIAVIDRGAGTMRVGWREITSGAASVSASTSVASLGSCANAADMILGNEPGGSLAPQTMNIAALYIATGSGVATGLSANLSTALSSFATYMKSQTSTKQARGLWFPDCPLNLESDPDQAPKVTDLRSTMGPTGTVISYVGNTMYRHRDVHWSHVPKDRTWESAVTYANASWEYFANECLLGLGSSWFSPSSELQIYYDSNGTSKAVGNTFNSNAGIAGWQTLNLASIEPKKSEGDWTGLWRIELGDIVSDG